MPASSGGDSVAGHGDGRGRLTRNGLTSRMAQPSLDDLLKAGVHFGHQTRRWNPKMRRFIFAERNGIHIIDLQKTLRQIELAQKLAREVILRGDNVLFVCTKRQLSTIVQEEAERASALYVTERWLGGLLTNFQTVKKQIRRLKDLEAGSETGGDFENYTKKEQLLMSRQRDKLARNLSGIKNMARLPGLMFVIDSKKERIAVSEAQQARHSDDRDRRHERRPGPHHGSDRRKRRRDPVGRADRAGGGRCDRRDPSRGAGPPGSRGEGDAAPTARTAGWSRPPVMTSVVASGGRAVGGRSPRRLRHGSRRAAGAAPEAQWRTT